MHKLGRAHARPCWPLLLPPPPKAWRRRQGRCAGKSCLMVYPVVVALPWPVAHCARAPRWPWFAPSAHSPVSDPCWATESLFGGHLQLEQAKPVVSLKFPSWISLEISLYWSLVSTNITSYILISVASLLLVCRYFSAKNCQKPPKYHNAKPLNFIRFSLSLISKRNLVVFNCVRYRYTKNFTDSFSNPYTSQLFHSNSTLSMSVFKISVFFS